MALLAPRNVAALAARHDVKRLIKALNVGAARRDAAIALGQLGATEAVTPLIAALRDPDAYVRQASAWSLGMLADARAVQPLIDALAHDGDDAVREWAMTALQRFGAPAVEQLLAALHAEDRMVRRASAEAIGRFGDGQAVEPLIAALRSGSDFGQRDLKCAAADALGRLGDARAIAVLVTGLTVGDDHEVRDACMAALCRIGAPAVEALIEAVRGGQGLARYTATEALGRIGDARGVEALLQLLHDEPGYLEPVAAALGRIGDSRAVAPLVDALRNRPHLNDDDRLTVVTALGGLGLPAAVAVVEALHGEGAHRRREFANHDVAKALGAIGGPALGLLISALADSDPLVRCAAAEGLGRAGAPAAVDALLTCRNDTDELVRATAAIALQSLGLPAALGPEEAALRDRACPLLARLWRGCTERTAAYAGSEYEALGELASLLDRSAAGMDADLLRCVSSLPDELELEPVNVDGDEYDQVLSYATVKDRAFAELTRRAPAWADMCEPRYEERR